MTSQHSPPVPDWRDVMAAVRAGADMATAAAAAAPAAAGQAPPILNFADLITTAASGLAGGAAPPRAGADPPGQSFEERLRAATERGEEMNILLLEKSPKTILKIRGDSGVCHRDEAQKLHVSCTKGTVFVQYNESSHD